MDISGELNVVDSNMISCQCGRSFGSEHALSQHRADKFRLSGNQTVCRTVSTENQVHPTKTRREDWLWRGLKRRKVVGTIEFPVSEPQTISVSSTGACEFLCSYNWVKGTQPTVTSPGFAPIWQSNKLPITLPRDGGIDYIDLNSFRSPEYPFQPLFRSLAVMQPQLRLDDADVVVNRNSLRKLLDFCEGRVNDSFRLNLLLVGNTLFIERCERSPRRLITGSQDPGYGRSFENAFTKYPRGLEDSMGHHRVLRYSLGDMKCVVHFEVDACYPGDQAPDQADSSTSGADQDDLSLLMSHLDLNNPPGYNAQDITQPTNKVTRRQVMPQSTAAELKSKSKSSNIGTFMPQLWFGRTPWLIIARHTQGTVKDVKVIDAAAQFPDWEIKHQAGLRKLATIISQLRQSVRSNSGMNCSAICLKGSSPRSINVVPSVKQRSPLPKGLIKKFWSMESTQSRVRP